jgi:putative Mg2+ transporter-C (MgtC) family protein
MNVITENEYIIRLVLAAIAGSIIGYEREKKSKPAGLVTHMLLCLSTALIAIIQLKTTDATINYIMSLEPTQQIILATSLKSDMTRLIAQVISGIGFIGSGVIIINRGSILGVTTAATIWLTASLGICIGMGYYVIAAITLILSSLIIFAVKKAEPFINKSKREKRVRIVTIDKESAQCTIKKVFNVHNIKIVDNTIEGKYDDKTILVYNIRTPKIIDFSKIVATLLENGEIYEVVKLY